tara:strand:- start:278 stop:523 length:246 start_codon:yes stop_codon:yes gene_type:complete
VDDIWPKGLSSARVGSLVRRSLYMDEFGRLFIPDNVGVIVGINEVENDTVYDVLFFMGPDCEDGPYPTLSLFDEDLMLLRV